MEPDTILDKRCDISSPLFLPVGNEQSIQTADGIPAVLIQYAGLGPAVQLLDPADIMLSGGVVLAGDRGGLDAIEEAGQCPEHGLHQIEVDAVLVRLNGKITVGVAATGERPGQPGSGL